jgi:predicted RNase H-like HicB family nuclease
VATGTTLKETHSRMRDTIQFHIEGLKREGLVIPEPSTKIKYVEVGFISKNERREV